MKRTIALFLVFVLMFSLSACSKQSKESFSSNSDIVIVESETIIDDTTSSSEKNNSSVESTTSETDDENQPDDNSADSQIGDDDNVENANASARPSVTICERIASNIYIVGGKCSLATEYIQVVGNGVTTTKIVPTKGKNESYFIGQVTIDRSTWLEIHAKEQGKELSNVIKKTVSIDASKQNMMHANDYMPVFGLNSRMHFYSAILTYTNSDFLTNAEKTYAKTNISDTVSAAKAVGAEVVYLVVPSSAAVYPETVPSSYRAASGETLYKAFKDIAEQSGAKVIYPLETMKEHTNDGDGYKIYSHTDSHWTTYGAYWGVNALLGHISQKYPSAASRSVQEMGFYTTELYGGDALFSFGDNAGFENHSKAASTFAETQVTGIKELTTLYSLKMPTDTLSVITRGKRSAYLTKDNATAKVETNPNGAGLPSAVIVRDSFGRTAYDMINDRFSKVAWLAENDYSNAISVIEENRPNYVIYIVSERNLLKVMMNQDVYLSDRL